MAPAGAGPLKRRLLSLMVVGGLVAAGASWMAARSHAAAAAPVCGVSGFALTTEQAQNAAIIAAVAYQKGMPDHAVTVALAAALQETKLRNLPYGDRDSVGLFQQRPSQGWGTVAQIMDPNYAASAFYDRLASVPGWQTMAVTDAAQSVQHSADSGAYAGWETEARALAVALTGEAPAGLSCRMGHFAGAAPPPSALGQAMASEMGTDLIGQTVSAATGWRVATWLVAHAYQYHVPQVSFAGLTWRASSGKWNGGPRPALSVVSVS
jgi:hypothetical protein